jgi:hypothetical protein
MGRADIAWAGSIQRGVADVKLGEVYTINLYGDLFE